MPAVLARALAPERVPQHPAPGWLLAASRWHRAPESGPASRLAFPPKESAA
ncbi:hypothetical protein [Duganella aceris]|uniref:Uncharacterized protein n=1 Tax=Duganella aceris TaxID=2703883 RepID=A0ABX0FLF5_9BURK|nr:hypothetical protein [Duganella aceris]NGZ85305.1 hypothetical protein [Duganella aceris]